MMTPLQLANLVRAAAVRIAQDRQRAQLCAELTSLEALATGLTQEAYDKSVMAVQTKALIGGLLR